MIPIKSGGAPPSFAKGFASEADFAHIPGAHLIDQNDISGISPSYFVSTLRCESQPVPHLSGNESPKRLHAALEWT
jgi:hypothetical protein